MADEPRLTGTTAAPRLVRGLRVGALLLVAALLALLIWRVSTSGRGKDVVEEVRSGKRPSAPAFSLPVIWNRSSTWPARVRPALRDGRLSLRELHGSPVIINFWASWCFPCQRETPGLAAAARANAGSVAFLGVNAHDFVADARRFLRHYHVDYVVVHDSGSTTAAYGLTGFPETFALDPRGRIVAHKIGAISRAELIAYIAEASKH